MKNILIAGIFTTLGACIGFFGNLVQSLIASHNNKKLLELQTRKEIEQKRYFEKEKLYMDIISFLPQLVFSINEKTEKINLSEENIIMFNSFNPRLKVYSTSELTQEFNRVCEQLTHSKADQENKIIIDNFVHKLLEDL